MARAVHHYLLRVEGDSELIVGADGQVLALRGGEWEPVAPDALWYRATVKPLDAGPRSGGASVVGIHRVYDNGSMEPVHWRPAPLAG